MTEQNFDFSLYLFVSESGRKPYVAETDIEKITPDQAVEELAGRDGVTHIFETNISECWFRDVSEDIAFKYLLKYGSHLNVDPGCYMPEFSNPVIENGWDQYKEYARDEELYNSMIGSTKPE